MKHIKEILAAASVLIATGAVGTAHAETTHRQHAEAACPALQSM